MTKRQRQARLRRLTSIALRISDRIIANNKAGRPTRTLSQRLGRVQKARMRVATGPEVLRAFEALGGFDRPVDGGARGCVICR